MTRTLLWLTVVGLLIAAVGCQKDQGPAGPEAAAPRPAATAREAQPAPAVPAVPAEPALPEPRRLGELFPADARKLLEGRGMSPQEFADYAFVPGSVVRNGDTATARVWRRSEGACFVRHTPDKGWSVWARLAPSLNLDRSRLPLSGVPAEVRSAEELARWLRGEPKRVLDLKVGARGKQIGLLGLAGLPSDPGDLARVEAAARAVQGASGVSRLSLTTLGREVSVVVGLAQRGGRWEVAEVRQVAGMPVTEFLLQVLPASRP